MQGYGLFHSSGQSRPTTNISRETAVYEPSTYIQTSTENGVRKEKKLAPAGSGFVNRMLMPETRRHYRQSRLTAIFNELLSVTQIHEGLREVDGLLTIRSYGQVTYGKISGLQ